MEELVLNISLDDLVEIEGFSVRTQNLCEYNNLKDLNSILNYYWINGDFLRLRNCGKMTNLKLIETCIKYESFLIKPNIEEDTEIEYYPENKFEPLLDETKAITLQKETIINNLIKTKFDELSVRSSNALRNCLNNDISLSNLKLILLAKESSIRNIHNIGEKSTTEIKDFIKSVKELIELVNTMEIEIETTIQIFNSFLKRTFSLSPIFINEIGKDYDFTAGMPIFKTLNVLIENGKIFHIRNNEIFKWGFSYYRELNFYSSDELADRLGITRERTRQMRLKLYEKLVSAFSFVRELEFNDLNLYGIDFTNNILEIDNELIIEINKNEGTNFNALFINKILSILLYFQFTLIGDEEGILFNRNSRTLHNWNTTYLILNNYVKIFDFEGLVEDVSFRLGQRIEEDYSFHFQTYLLDFQKEVCISFIENIAQIAEYILFKEFELTIDMDENLVFKRNVKKQVIDYVYEILKERHEPLNVYEMYEIIEKNSPGITRSAESLRGSCQGDANLIFFGRSSTYGLKVWEDELNIKGGTIRNIVEEFLMLHDYPKHIIEVTEYVNLYRHTNTKNIISNLRLDDSGTFIFFNQSFIGLAEKKHLLEYLPYGNIPQYLGRSLMAEIKEKGRIDFRKTVDYLSSKISIPESNIEMIITHIIKENNLQIENNFISEANDNRRN